VLNATDTLYSLSVLFNSSVAVKLPLAVHVAGITVLPPYPRYADDALEMLLAGTFTSNRTVVEAQLTPLPVLSFSGAYNVIDRSAAEGNFGTRSNGEFTDRNTK